MTRTLSILVLAALLGLAATSLYAVNAEEADHAGHAVHGSEQEGHRETAAAKHGEASDHHDDEVHLSEAQRRRLDLRVGPAARGSARALVSLPASIAFDADRIAKVGPRLRAKVVRVTRDLGARVSAGETLAIMDSVALGKAKARYLTARAHLETAEAAYAREKTLAAQKISSEADRLEARARFREARADLDAARAELRLYGLSRAAIESIEAGGEAPLSRYVLSSPIEGVVQARDLTPGETVGPERTPIHVVDTRRVWVMMEAYERDLPALALGQSLELELRALPGRHFAGRIDWISRALDPDSRTLRLRAVLDNPDGLLRAGMFGTAVVRTETTGNTALLPVDAVQMFEGRPTVFVPAAEEGAFRAVPVALGEEAAGRVEVVSGIEPGDAVVMAGAFDLKSILTAAGRSAAHSH